MQRMTSDAFRAQHVKPQAAIKQVLGRPVRALTPSGPTAGRVEQVRRDDGPTEKEVQAAIVKVLELNGYTVMQTSQRRASGVSLGLPDLMVTKLGWCNVWRGLECKRNAKSPLSVEQQALADARMITVVWSPEMALAAMKGTA